MMRLTVGLVVLLSFLGLAPAEEKPAPGNADEAQALVAARALAAAARGAGFAKALAKHLDAGAILEGACGRDLAGLEKGERDEAATLLRAYLGARLEPALKALSAKASYDATRRKDGRVAVTIRVAGGGQRLVFARSGGGMRIVDLGSAGATSVEMLKAGYTMRKSGRRLDPLAFAWIIASRHASSALLPKPVWRAPLAAPNPGWLSRETLHLGVETPALTGAAVDAPSNDAWVVVSITRGGVALLRPSGPSGPLRRFKLASEDPGVQDDAIQALTKDLAALARGVSTRRALINADGGVKWKYVQWVMQAFAHPTVKIHQISFSLQRGEAPADARRATKGAESPFGRIDVELPMSGSPRALPAATVKIKMFRRDMRSPTTAHTILKMNQARIIYKLPAGWKGRAHESEKRIEQYDRTVTMLRLRLEKDLAALGASPADVQGELVAPPPKGGAVPHEDVMQMVHMLRRAGIKNLVFEGAATPLTARERAARAARK